MCLILNEKDTGLLGTPVRDLMIPATKVAFVNLYNSLEHALLILTQSGYTAIPVLDRDSTVQGVINTTLIIQAILDVHGYQVEKLGQLTVEAVMSKDIPKVKEQQNFRRAFEVSINWPFVCVDNDEGKFVGIVTRKTVLARLYQDIRGKRGGDPRNSYL